MQTSSLLKWSVLLSFSLTVSALPSNDILFSPFQSALFTTESDPNSQISFANSTLAPSTESAPEQLDPNSSTNSDPDPSFDLLKRAACQNGYNSCSTLRNNYADVCCATTAVCSLDNGGNAACCPIGSFCTGTIVPNVQTTGTAMTTGTNGASNTASVVPNNFFPFPYLATSTITNAAACSAAVSACSNNYNICTQDLQGGSFGVTVNAPGGGGVTVAAPNTAVNVGLASATSICSSLSTQAGCGAVGSGVCATFTGATGATAAQTGFIVATGASGANGRTGKRVGTWAWASGGLVSLGALLL